MGSLISREKFLKKQDFKIEKIVLDEKSGDFIFVKQMSGYDRDRLEQSMTVETTDEKGNPISKVTTENFKAKMICATVCDDKGMMLLKPDDYKVINAHFTAEMIEKISLKATELNKFSAESQEKAIKN